MPRTASEYARQRAAILQAIYSADLAKTIWWWGRASPHQVRQAGTPAQQLVYLCPFEWPNHALTLHIIIFVLDSIVKLKKWRASPPLDRLQWLEVVKLRRLTDNQSPHERAIAHRVVQQRSQWTK